MINLEYLIKNSGDSILENYSYSKGILALILNIEELNKKLKIKIKTEYLSFNNFYIGKNEELYRTCRIELEDLTKVLSVENGIYLPSINFGKMMNESKSHYNLAYGKKISELKEIFSLVGYGKLVSCLISELNDIIIEEM
ncbi:MAG: hypothetical protein QM564_08730 [Bergeyella sp.]